MIKKILLICFILINFSFSQQLELKSGWNLIGAKEDISISSLNKSCINAVYLYDAYSNTWSDYTRNSVSSQPVNGTNIQPPLIDKSTANTISSLNVGTGVWIHAAYSCRFNVNYNNNNNFDGVELYRKFCWGCHGNGELDESARENWEKIQDNKGGKGYLRYVLTYNQLEAIERDTRNLRYLPKEEEDEFPYHLAMSSSTNPNPTPDPEPNPDPDPTPDPEPEPEPDPTPDSNPDEPYDNSNKTGIDLYYHYCYACHGTRAYNESSSEISEKIYKIEGMKSLAEKLSSSDIKKIADDTKYLSIYDDRSSDYEITPVSVPDSTGDDSLDGMQLYQKYCYSCHGTKSYGEEAYEISREIDRVEGMKSLKDVLDYNQLEKIYRDTKDYD